MPFTNERIYIDKLLCDIFAKAGKVRGCDFFLLSILELGNKITIVIRKDVLPSFRMQGSINLLAMRQLKSEAKNM